MQATVEFDLEYAPSLESSTESYLEPANQILNSIAAGSCEGGEWTGWFDWPKRQGHALLKEIESWKNGISLMYDTVVVVGIGGSYLGAKAVNDLLSHTFSHARRAGGHGDRKADLVFLGQHMSEASTMETLEYLEERRPLCVVISKSGTTTEPGIAFRVLRQYFEKRFGSEARNRIIAVTDESKGALRALADSEGYPSFVVPDNVGGRFSVLTAVGLVPLVLAGVDCASLLAGADDMFTQIQSNPSHAALRYAAFRKAAFVENKTMEVLAFNEPKFCGMGEWWKQLFGESEGKDHKGLFPASVLYSTDLHSLGQYLQDGVRSMVETFVHFQSPFARSTHSSEDAQQTRLVVPRVSSNIDDQLSYLEGKPFGEINEAAMAGTIMAHRDGGVPCVRLEFAALSEKTIGGLIAFFETSCGVSGGLLGVNPYDQPGVEDYKRNLFQILGKPGV